MKGRVQCSRTPITIEKIPALDGVRSRDRYINKPARNLLSYRGHFAGKLCFTFVAPLPISITGVGRGGGGGQAPQ